MSQGGMSGSGGRQTTRGGQWRHWSMSSEHTWRHYMESVCRMTRLVTMRQRFIEPISSRYILLLYRFMYLDFSISLLRPLILSNRRKCLMLHNWIKLHLVLQTYLDHNSNIFLESSERKCVKIKRTYLLSALFSFRQVSVLSAALC